MILAYLEEHPCKSCGMGNPVVLDFHHRNPHEKFMGISEMIKGRFSIDDIMLEMEKCDVLCSNCHRILHAEERGNYRSP